MAAFQAYSHIIDTEFNFFERAVRVQDASLFQQSIGTLDASRALVMVGREAALVGGALAARGQMSTADRQLFANTVASQRLLMGDAQVLFTTIEAVEDAGTLAHFRRLVSDDCRKA